MRGVVGEGERGSGSGENESEGLGRFNFIWVLLSRGELVKDKKK